MIGLKIIRENSATNKDFNEIHIIFYYNYFSKKYLNGFNQAIINSCSYRWVRFLLSLKYVNTTIYKGITLPARVCYSP